MLEGSQADVLHVILVERIVLANLVLMLRVERVRDLQVAQSTSPLISNTLLISLAHLLHFLVVTDGLFRRLSLLLFLLFVVLILTCFRSLVVSSRHDRLIGNNSLLCHRRYLGVRHLRILETLIDTLGVRVSRRLIHSCMLAWFLLLVEAALLNDWLLYVVVVQFRCLIFLTAHQR